MRVVKQKRQILDMLRERPITARDAVQIGCMRLAARIHDLRADGHEIHSEMITADGTRFAQYRLVQLGSEPRRA